VLNQVTSDANETETIKYGKSKGVMYASVQRLYEEVLEGDGSE
jgi:hypothetical protein